MVPVLLITGPLACRKLRASRISTGDNRRTTATVVWL